MRNDTVGVDASYIVNSTKDMVGGIGVNTYAFCSAQLQTVTQGKALYVYRSIKVTIPIKLPHETL